jgi:hypothetical protein
VGQRLDALKNASSPPASVNQAYAVAGCMIQEQIPSIPLEVLPSNSKGLPPPPPPLLLLNRTTSKATLNYGLVGAWHKIPLENRNWFVQESALQIS